MTAERIIENTTKELVKAIKAHSGKPCKRCEKDFVEWDSIVMEKNGSSHYHLECWESVLQ